MASEPPSVVVLAGPNGAGKSTAAPVLLPESLGITEFVNADTIARGLSGFNPESVAFEAGRIMLTRMRELARERESFAFETTLASRTFAGFLSSLSAAGYTTSLFFLCLPTAEMAISRVRSRVDSGGHDVPDAVVRRRFQRGIQNLFNLYLRIVDTWNVLDNSGSEPRPIASGGLNQPLQVLEHSQWTELTSRANPKV